jgi:hypothetical protein
MQQQIKIIQIDPYEDKTDKMIKSKQNEVKQACALCFWCKAR